jgi:hypothetical protein
MSGSEGPVELEDWALHDLVQVRADGSFGSGMIVGEGLVLTAFHCVADPAHGWTLRNTIAVNLWRDLFGLNGAQPFERSYLSTVIWHPEIPPTGQPPDLALLKLHVSAGRAVPSPTRLGPLFYAAVGATKIPAFALGFPHLIGAGVLPGGRDEGVFPGDAHLLSRSRPTISFTSTIIAASGGPKDWAGLSGGPLISRGALLGIMRGGRPAIRADRTLEAEPLAFLLEDSKNAGLADLLGAQKQVVGSTEPDFTRYLKSLTTKYKR